MPTDSVEFHEEATAEYDAAFDWYLEQSPDAARKFDAEVDRALTQILQAPQRWTSGPYSTRKFLLRQFPFIVIYRQLASAHIQIVAIAHTSRRPDTRWAEFSPLDLPRLTGQKQSQPPGNQVLTASFVLAMLSRWIGCAILKPPGGTYVSYCALRTI